MTPGELIEALTAATTDGEALAAIAEAVRAGSDPPTPETLAQWWPHCPDTARTEAEEALRTLARTCEPEAPDGLAAELGFTAWAGWDGEEPGRLFAGWPIAQHGEEGGTRREADCPDNLDSRRADTPWAIAALA